MMTTAIKTEISKAEARQKALNEYIDILNENGIPFNTDDVFITAGNFSQNTNWIVFVSVLLKYSTLVLRELIALAKRELGLGFRIAKNKLELSKLNEGYYGPKHLGKAFQIRGESLEILAKICKHFDTLPNEYIGPIILDTYKISKCCYVAGLDLKFSLNDLFANKYLKEQEKKNRYKERSIVGKKYVLNSVLHRSPRGNVYLATYFAINGTSQTCVVKQGFAKAASDTEGRTVRDRLLWQKELSEKLKGILAVPKYLDFTDYDDSSYLTIEFIPGQILADIIRNFHQNSVWKESSNSLKVQLLTYFLKVVDVIAKLHRYTIVHRDISSNNFIVNENNEIVMIDLELAYSLSESKPSPPFYLGTSGYMSYNQRSYGTPQFEDDIFALGALLAYMIGGLPPAQIFPQDKEIINVPDILIEADSELIELILKCLNKAENLRPRLSEIQHQISAFIQKISNI